MASEDHAGGGPKKFRFVWTPEANEILLEVSNLCDSKSSTYKEDLYKAFKLRIGSRAPTILSVWTQLSKISKLKTEDKGQDKRTNVKWTPAIFEILLRVGMEAEAINERNKTIKFSDKLLELFLQQVPQYQGASDHLRKLYREHLTSLQLKDQGIIQTFREEIEQKLTEEDLARAHDSDNNIPDDLRQLRKWGKIGFDHGAEPMFKGVCSHCAKLLFGDYRTNKRWNIISRDDRRYSRHPFAQSDFELPIEEMYASGVIPNGLPYKTDDNKIYICKHCFQLSAKQYLIENFVNLRNPETNKMDNPPVLAAINTEAERAMISLLGTYHNVDTKCDDFRRRYLHLRGEINLLSKQDQAYRYMFGIMAGKAPENMRKAKKEQYHRVQKALMWLRKWNRLFQEFYTNCETIFGFVVKGGQQIIAFPGAIATTKGTDIVEELADEEEGYFLPAEKNIGEDDEFVGDDFNQYVSHPKDISQKPVYKGSLREWTRQNIMSNRLEAMAFPADFPGGIGSYDPKDKNWKKNVKHRDYCKLLLLHFDDRFRRNHLLLFFCIDRYIKTSLINHAHMYVAPIGDKAMEKPKAVDLLRGGSEVYKQYGSTIAGNIPGSRSYWFIATQELMAIADEKKRHPDYFLTFTTNDNWPEIQSILIHGPGITCTDCPHRDQRIPATQLPTLASIAFDQRWKKWCTDVLFNPNGELGTVETFWFRREYQKRGAVHLHGVVWVKPSTKKEGVVRATKPRTNSKDPAVIATTQKVRDLVNKYQLHSHIEERCFFRGTKKLSACKYNFPAPLVFEERFDGVRKLYRRTKDEDKMVVPYSLSQLLIFQSCVNIQEVNGESWKLYLPKYISKPEVTSNIPIGRTRLDKNASITERYMKMRVMGAVEVNDNLLQYPMKICNIDVIYLDIPLTLDDQTKIIKQKRHLNEDEDADLEDLYYDTKFEKYLKRPLTTEELRQITYSDFWRTFAYGRESVPPTEGVEGEDIVEPQPADGAMNQQLVDRHNRRIYHRKHKAVIRYQFLLPYGDDQEKYCMKLLLDNIPVDINTFPNEFRPPGFTTYLNECLRRGLWNEKEIGLGFLQRAQELGVSEHELRSIAGQLEIGNFLSKPQLQTFFDTHLQNLMGNDSQYDHNVIEGVDPNPDLGDFPVPKMRLLSLQEYLDLMSEEQGKIFEYIRTEISEGRQVLANIIGPAGTGKSFLINALCALFKDINDHSTNQSFSILAPTGSAAFDIFGQTIHSKFRFDTKLKSHIKPNTIESWLIRYCDVFLIDEMSMIDKYQMEEIERNTRIHTTLDQRGKKFGGKHIITFGDPAQLPSIRVPWFDGSEFRHFKNFVMKTIQRQSNDPMFAKMLLEIRVGNVTTEVADYFKERLIDGLDYQRIIDQRETVIVSLRRDVDYLNDKILELLVGDVYEFVAIDTDMSGNPLSDTAQKRLMNKDERMADILHIKLGALVHIRRNINVAKGLVNGRHAIVEQIHLDSNLIVLKSLDGKEHWPISRWKQTIDDYGENKYIRQQFPISLGWAATVHRIQGKTLNRAIVNLDASFFASGQAYTALSRTRRIENLQLLAFDESRVYISSYYSQLLEWISKNDYLLPESERDPSYPFPIWTYREKFIDPRKGDEEDEPEEETDQRWDDKFWEEMNEEMGTESDELKPEVRPVEDIFESLKLSSQTETKPKPKSTPIPRPQTQPGPIPGTSTQQAVPQFRRPNGVTTVEKCEDLLLQMIQQNVFVSNDVINTTFNQQQFRTFGETVLREIRSQLPQTYEKLQGKPLIERFIQPIPMSANNQLQYNYKLLNVVGNGDCFYSAIAAILYGNEKHQAIIRFGALFSIMKQLNMWQMLGNTHGQLMSQICLSIATSNKHRNESFSKYSGIYPLEQRFNWADNLQEMAVSVAINRSVDIFSTERIFEGRFQPWAVEPRHRSNIAVFFDKNTQHFMSLLPNNDGSNCFNFLNINPREDFDLGNPWYPLEEAQVLPPQPLPIKTTSPKVSEPTTSAFDTTSQNIEETKDSQKRPHPDTSSGSSDTTDEEVQILNSINNECNSLLKTATEDSANKVFDTSSSIKKYFWSKKSLFDKVIKILRQKNPITVEAIPTLGKQIPSKYGPMIGGPFKLVNVTADGHCWYRAVSLCLFGNENYVPIIRLGALYGVLTSFHYFEQFESHYSITPSDLCLSIATVRDTQRVRNNYGDAILRINPDNPDMYHWASNPQELATSIAIDRPIDIFNPPTRQTTTFHGGRVSNRIFSDNKRSVVIHYVQEGKHFMSLIPNTVDVLIKHSNILVRRVHSKTFNISYYVYPNGKTTESKAEDDRIKAIFNHIGDFHYEIFESHIDEDMETQE